MATQRELTDRSQQIFLAKMVVLAGALLFLGSGFLWLERVHGNAQNTFWSMVDGNLKSYGQSQQTAQSDPSRNLLQEQVTQLQLGAQAAAVGTSILTQNPNTPDQLSITTETIGTPASNYVQYADIEINQKTPTGQTPDFSKLEGVWAQETNIQGGKSTFADAMFGSLGRIPTAYLQPSARKELVGLMKDKDVYKIDSAKVKKEYRGGRPVYIYEVEVNVRQYVVMLKKFDVLSGLNQLSGVDPDQFPPAETISMQVTVDILSRNLVDVTYVSSKQTETFSGYGAFVPVRLPTQTVSVQELEKKLQAALLGQ